METVNTFYNLVMVFTLWVGEYYTTGGTHTLLLTMAIIHSVICFLIILGNVIKEI